MITCRKDALKSAAEMKLDLVEFKAPQHGTKTQQEMPVAKIMDYRQLRRSRQENLAEILSTARQIQQDRAAAAAIHAPVRSARGSGSRYGIIHPPDESYIQAPATTHRKLDLLQSSPSQHQDGTRVVGPESQRKAQAQTQHPSTQSPSRQSVKTQRGAQVHGSETRESGGSTKGKKAGKVRKMKEVIFGPKIAKHDIDVRMKKVRSWLESGFR